MKTDFVLITPIHNEDKYIRQVLESVIAQTIRPKKWVLVDDGSTDRTGEIIQEYAAEYDFIIYYPLKRPGIKTYYAQRIKAVMAGIEYLKHMEYDFLAVLDADLTLPPTYYENILREFDRNSKLGIASGIFTNYINGRPQKVLRDSENISTPGALQVFRRKCYESIGGHVPLLYGGSDALVGILARMKGWQTRAFPQYETIHYRHVGVWSGSNILRSRFRQGMQEYDLGSHPLFVVAKTIRRIFKEKPYFLCGVMRFLGFIYLCLRRKKRGISDDALAYVRKEQIGRIFSSMRSVIHPKWSSGFDVPLHIAEMPCFAKKDFILISAVYNEEEFIEQLIESVIFQTVRPKRWIIVDDGSTDNTGEMIKQYAEQHDFILYHRLERSNVKSYYHSKTKAFLAGYERIKHIEHSFVASLDADITLEPTYYDYVLREFGYNPRLGIASGIYSDSVNGRLQKVVTDSHSTPGGLQVFRRECYESIGGYTPLRYGGEDALANIVARMHGWQTTSFPEYKTIHHRPIGVRGGASILRGKFLQGLAEYHLWTHPMFMLPKSLRRMFIERPYLVGSAARLLGFLEGYLRGEKRDMPEEVKKFVRKEQIRRLVTYPYRHY